MENYTITDIECPECHKVREVTFQAETRTQAIKIVNDLQQEPCIDCHDKYRAPVDYLYRDVIPDGFENATHSDWRRKRTLEMARAFAPTKWQKTLEHINREFEQKKTPMFDLGLCNPSDIGAGYTMVWSVCPSRLILLNPDNIPVAVI